MSKFTKPESPDRSKIDIEDAQAVKHWARALNINEDELRALVDKVGNAAATVRKEIENKLENAQGCDGKKDPSRT